MINTYNKIYVKQTLVLSHSQALCWTRFSIRLWTQFFCWFNRPRLNQNVSVQAASLNQHNTRVPKQSPETSSEIAPLFLRLAAYYHFPPVKANKLGLRQLELQALQISPFGWNDTSMGFRSVTMYIFYFDFLLSPCYHLATLIVVFLRR